MKGIQLTIRITFYYYGYLSKKYQYGGEKYALYVDGEGEEEKGGNKLDESAYRAKIILIKYDGYTVPEIRRMATNHHDNNNKVDTWIVLMKTISMRIQFSINI